MTSISQNDSWYIYAIHNGDSIYRYVGFTTSKDPQSRLKSHLRHPPKYAHWPIYRWTAKQDKSQISLDVLEECPKGDKEHLYAREIYWINHYRNIQGSLTDAKTENYLLNVLDGGRCARLGVKHTEETKAKMRAGHAARGPRDYKMDEESRKRRSDAMKGRTFSEETRAKLSAAKIGNKQSGYALHVRHHVNKNKTNPACQHCPDLTSEQESGIIVNVGSQ